MIIATIKRPPGNKKPPRSLWELLATTKNPRVTGLVLAGKLFSGSMGCLGGHIFLAALPALVRGMRIDTACPKGALRATNLSVLRRVCGMRRHSTDRRGGGGNWGGSTERHAMRVLHTVQILKICGIIILVLGVLNQ